MTAKTTVRLPEDVREALRQIGKDQGKSFAQLLEEAAELLIKAYGEDERLVRARQAKARSGGRFVDHDKLLPESPPAWFTA